jgi:hypothetical protein
VAGPARADRAVTVSLRPMVAADRAWLDTWLPAVAREVGYDAAELAARAPRERWLRARVIERDGEDVGVVVYRMNAPRRGAALFELVATPPAHARRGAGMTAAALAEEEMRAGGVRTAYAPASEAHGINMYFWIRLGYAPILRDDWPCAREGFAWLRRTLT